MPLVSTWRAVCLPEPGGNAQTPSAHEGHHGEGPADRVLARPQRCGKHSRCPNVKPAEALLKQLGFTQVKVLYVAENFKTNWIDAGYPVE